VIPWDQRYGADTYFYGIEPNDFLREQAPALPHGGEVLCLGEGEGRNAVYLAKQGHAVVAVDQSPVGLQKAQRLAASRGIRITTVTADLAHFRIEPAQWSAIVSIWCHLPRALRAEVHQRAVVGLKPGGMFLLEAYTPAQLQHRTGGPSTADLLPSLAELRAELAGLEFVHAMERERIVQEGAGHCGLSAVVQVLAVKRD
jgi:SAM-dependent methyltransferase